MLESILLKLAGVFISLGMDKFGSWIKKKSIKKKNIKKEIPLEDIKKSIRILFIDDEDFSAKLSIIRDSGWNVNQVKEVLNIDSAEIVNADIIFIDYIGVGKILTPKEEGIGLLKYIRKKYPNKFIVFLSGYAGYIPGHEVHSIADAWIDKHADSFVYIDQIEDAAKKIYESRC